MKYWVALICLPTLLAATGTAPLVTGAVRDQYGAPIAGASITAGLDRAITDAAGTFALETRALRVTVSCNYCRTTNAIVAGDGTVVAIVPRYKAVEQTGISPTDLRALPYARIESAISLQPFVVLNDSRSVLPGPRLSYYGVSRFGGLFVDDAVPSYDIASGVTAVREVPSFDGASSTATDQSQAFRYGDLAAGGTFFVQTTPQGQAQASVMNGTQRALAVSGNAGPSSFNTALSADEDDSRLRADASIHIPFGIDSIGVTAIAARDSDYDDGGIESNESALRLHFDHAAPVHAYADVIADRAGYTALSSYAMPVQGVWSDTSVQGGFSSSAPLAPFADVGVRWSSGYYEPPEIAAGGRIAGTIVQTHLTAGVQSQMGRLQWRAGFGAFLAQFGGGSFGRSIPLSGRLLTPSVSLSYDLAPQWNIAVDAGQSFRLPTLVETYGYGADQSNLHLDRYATQDAKLTFADLHRLRVSLIAMNTHVSDLDTGTVSAGGAALAWQVAPDISVRAWTLHFDDATQPYAPIFRYAAAPQPSTPQSIWTTYENASGLRADVIWRSDLIDYRPDTHVDASISAPLAGGFRWFIGTERRHRERYVEAGLRLAK